jgi:hypothetical protein
LQHSAWALALQDVEVECDAWLCKLILQVFPVVLPDAMLSRARIFFVWLQLLL